MGTLIISMAIFNSYVSNLQWVNMIKPTAKEGSIRDVLAICHPQHEFTLHYGVPIGYLQGVTSLLFNYWDRDISASDVPALVNGLLSTMKQSKGMKQWMC